MIIVFSLQLTTFLVLVIVTCRISNTVLKATICLQSDKRQVVGCKLHEL